MYSIFGDDAADFSKCDDFVRVPEEIVIKICNHENNTACDAILRKDVNWAETCTSLLDVYSITDVEKTSFCGQDENCREAVDIFFTSEIDEWMEDFIKHATMPTEMNISECTENLQCKEALFSYPFNEYCSATLEDVFLSCSDCQAELLDWRQNFNKQEFCEGLINAEEDVAETLKDGLQNCSSGCTNVVDDIDFNDFCLSRISSHDVFAPHALSHNLSAYCRDQLFIILPMSVENDESLKLDYESDCTSLGTYGSVNVYTENGKLKGGQCRKVDCECTEVGLAGDRCNLNCPISSFDNSACNEKTGLGKCCAAPEDGTQLTAANCVTDILTSSFSLTNVGSCVCFNAGTDDVIAGFNCEEKCKKCNLENGECSSLPQEFACA